MMDLYEKSTYDIQRYIRCPKIKLEDEHLVLFTLFDQLVSDYEKVKAEVQAKEEFSQEDIQELLVEPSMVYSHYSTFVHKFVITMEEYRKCNIALDVKKVYIFNPKEEKILSQHEAWSKHFHKETGWNCIIVKYYCKLFFRIL